MPGAQRKMISNIWRSVNVSIILSFLHKLIKIHNLVKAGEKHDLLLVISEYFVYQSKNSQCKETHMKAKLNGPLSNH